MDIQIDIYEPVMSIGTVANKLQISVQTVRLYEHEGLILPHKSPGGHRLFSHHDLEKLNCIRNMITEHGINLQGIKRLMSMIPCWELKGGLDDDCRNCPAYHESSGPCWALKRVGEKCTLQDCRSCPVYRIQINCNKMKEIIYGHKKDAL